VPAVAVGNAGDDTAAGVDGPAPDDVAALVELVGGEVDVRGVGAGLVVLLATAGNFLSSPRQCSVAKTAPAAITTTSSERRRSRTRPRSLRRWLPALRGSGAMSVMENGYRAQASMPSRRADLARWRAARNLRNRLTSIGSASRAAVRSIRAFSAW